jgi:hypothetical protein
MRPIHSANATVANGTHHRPTTTPTRKPPTMPIKYAVRQSFASRTLLGDQVSIAPGRVMAQITQMLSAISTIDQTG